MTTVATASTAGDVDETIGLNVHALLYRRRNNQKELALALGITPSVLSKKLRGESSWSARQIAITAAFLNAEPGRLFAEHTLPTMRPKLRMIRGQGHDPQPRTPLMTPIPTGI